MCDQFAIDKQLLLYDNYILHSHSPKMCSKTQHTHTDTRSNRELTVGSALDHLAIDFLVALAAVSRDHGYNRLDELAQMTHENALCIVAEIHLATEYSTHETLKRRAFHSAHGVPSVPIELAVRMITKVETYIQFDHARALCLAHIMSRHQ